jgi:hypothetical protein
METPDTHNIPKPDLFSKIGPLPAWGWGLIVVGAYLVYRRMSGGSAQAVDNPVESESFVSGDDPNASLPTIDPSSAGYNYNDVLEHSYTGSVAGSGTSYSTNQQWGISVISNLIKMGRPAGDVTSAITYYLSGHALTAAQAGIVTDAIANFGPPPLPLPLVSGDSSGGSGRGSSGGSGTPIPTPTPVPTPTPTPVPVSTPAPPTKYYGEPGIPVYTTAQLAAMTPAQRFAVQSHAYQTNDAADAAHSNGYRP